MWSTEIGWCPTVPPPIVFPMLNVCHIFWALILGQISWISVFNSVSDFSCRSSACGQIAVTIWEMSPLLSLPCLTAPRPPQEITPPPPASLFPTAISPKSHLSDISMSKFHFLKVPGERWKIKTTTFNFFCSFCSLASKAWTPSVFCPTTNPTSASFLLPPAHSTPVSKWLAPASSAVPHNMLLFLHVQCCSVPFVNEWLLAGRSFYLPSHL